MQRVIHRSIVITLEIVPVGLEKSRAEQATAAIAGAWLHYIGQHLVQTLAMPAYHISVRHLPFDPDQGRGAQIQILLCWIVLQARHQEINSFDRVM
jgi:hypothetical protein